MDAVRSSTIPGDTKGLLPDGGHVNELPEVEESHSVNIDQADVEPSKEAIIVEEVGEEAIAADPPFTTLTTADQPFEDPNPAEPI